MKRRMLERLALQELGKKMIERVTMFTSNGKTSVILVPKEPKPRHEVLQQKRKHGKLWYVERPHPDTRIPKEPKPRDPQEYQNVLAKISSGASLTRHDRALAREMPEVKITKGSSRRAARYELA